MKPVVLASLHDNCMPRYGKSVTLFVKNRLLRVDNIINVQLLDNNVFAVEDKDTLYLVGDKVGISDETPILNKCFFLKLKHGYVKIPHLEQITECKHNIPGYKFSKLRTYYSTYIVCLQNT